MSRAPTQQSLNQLYQPFTQAISGVQQGFLNQQNQPAPSWNKTDWRSSPMGGYPVYTWGVPGGATRNSGPPDPRQTQAGIMGSLVGAQQSDVLNLQGAADEQTGRERGAVDRFGNFLGQVPGMIGQGTQMAAGALAQAAGSAAGLGSQVMGDFDRRAGNILPSLDAGLEKVNTLGQQAIDAAKQWGGAAVAAAENALSGFNSGFHAQVANATAAIERNAMNQNAEWEKALASGTMSPGAVHGMRREALFDMNQQMGQVKAQLGMSYETTKAQLGMAVAGITQQTGEDIAKTTLAAGEMTQASESLRSQVATALSGQGLEAQKILQGYQSLFAGIKQQEANLYSASSMAAVNALMSGNTSLFSMIKESPQNVVSQFAGLMQIAQLMTAPGGMAAVPTGGSSLAGGGGGQYQNLGSQQQPQQSWAWSNGGGGGGQQYAGAYQGPRAGEPGGDMGPGSWLSDSYNPT